MRGIQENGANHKSPSAIELSSRDYSAFDSEMSSDFERGEPLYANYYGDPILNL